MLLLTLIALLAGQAPAGGGQAPAAPALTDALPGTDTRPRKDALPGAINVTRVDATVLCGGATSAEAFPELKKRGFASVVNLRREDEQGADIPENRTAATAAGLQFIHIPVARTGPDDATVTAFLAAVTNPANQPVYIHCASANRVGALWLVKRVVGDGWDVARATTEANAIGLTSDELRQRAIDYVTRQSR
jgi:uncharacterized protein (TIGR01244 family)